MHHRPFIPPPLRLSICDHCGLAGVRHPGTEYAPEKFYQDEGYVIRKLPIHYVHPAGAEKPVPGPDHQVELLAELLPDNPRILDIGCFDGRLLRSFRRKYAKARLVGYDVSWHNARFFDDDVTFVSGGLANIDDEFDLIVMSHSLQYEPDLKMLFTHLSRLISPHGRLYLHVPDVESKPSGLLFADLHHHFTTPALCNLAQLHGFSPKVVAGSGFRRDAIIVAQPDRSSVERPMLQGGVEAVEKGLSELQEMARKVLAIRDQGPWNILGTTIEAAFINFLLEEQVAGFVDEAPSSVNLAFYGHSVRHPEALSEGDKTILPLGPRMTDVLARFQAAYRGQFVLL